MLNRKGIKIVEKENIHFTLKFLGEVEDSRVELIKDALGRIKAEAFRLHVRGIGYFPPSGSIRVIWVGVKEGEDEMSKLAGKVEDAMKKLGFRKEKNFIAHATIARVKKLSSQERRKVLDEIEPYSDEDFGWMDVKDFRLKKSTLTPKGPIYSDVEIFGLGK
ncbi:MAG TPA: RNA 2',3'-cyclic phosphodiesterase [Archaeoglobaceae archaeon]|nr:RNA 2',3'-cyclic phosphodiesterase [Archaeoglobaceae archaeon]